MNYGVYHAEKGTISSGGIGKHIDREPGAEHTYQHADPNRIHLNEHVTVNAHCDKELHVAISDRIIEGYAAKNKAGELKAIRKDAVKYTTHILTGSHEQMNKIEADSKLRRAWIDKNLEFVKSEYGEKNIVRFSVHRDEKTMHIHAITIPLTDDGRLSAKEVLGGKLQMSQRQDRYANEMKSFGFERGQKATGIKHEDARQYYARMETALSSGNESEDLTIKKTFLGADIGVDNEKTIENMKARIKAQKTALKSKSMEIDKLKKQQIESANFKNKLLETNRSYAKAFTKLLANDEHREQQKQFKIKELGEKYGYDIRNEFRFVAHSIQERNDKQVSTMVGIAVEKVGREKKLSTEEIALLFKSNEVKDQYRKLIEYREHLNDIDRSKGRSRGI